MPILPVSFLDHIAELIVPALLLGFFNNRLVHPRPISQLAIGLLFGAAGLLSMADPIVFRPGVIFDARNVVVVISGPAGGPLAVLVATAVVGIMRAGSGGVGLFPALVSIGLAAITSIGFCWYLHHRRHPFDHVALHFLAGLASFPPLIGVLFLPSSAITGEMLTTWIPLIAVTNLVGVELVGLLILRDQELRHLAAALEESSAQLRAIADNAPGILYQRVLRRDGQIVYPYMSNGVEDILGIPAPEAVGDASRVLSLMLPEDLSSYQRSVEVSRRTMKPWGFEARFKRQDQRLIWLRSQAIPRPGADGAIVWDGFALDITERKQLEEELLLARKAAESASAAKGRFLANVTHELRAPLNAIAGYSHLVKRGLQHSQQHERERHMLRMIESATQHLASMIDDLLDVSAIEANKIQLSKEDIALDILFHEVEEILRVRADHVGISLEVVVPEACRINADPRRLKQILINLGSNAVKFTEAGGSVTLSAECVNGGCKITVADTGIGILPSDLNSILQPFGQVDNFVNRRGGGTGLGLPLTKRLVELHGGRLLIDSELGNGTTVTVTLPDVKAPIKVANQH